MSRRSDTRIKITIPVRLWGIDANGKPFNEEVETTDVSLLGAKLGGLRSQLKAGEIVGMQSPTGKARFRVTSVGEADSEEAGTVSVACVEPGKCIWEAKLFDAPPEPTPLLEPIGSRRKSVRYLCQGGAEVTSKDVAAAQWCKLADISYSGCYLETPAPLPPGMEVYLTLSTGGMVIHCEGTVRTSHTTVGMGIKFEDMQDKDAELLGKLINRLAGTEEDLEEGSDDGSEKPVKMRPTLWKVNVTECYSAIRALQEIAEAGEIGPDPKVASDMERLVRAMSELRESVYSRVTNDDTQSSPTAPREREQWFDFEAGVRENS